MDLVVARFGLFSQLAGELQVVSKVGAVFPDSEKTRFDQIFSGHGAFLFCLVRLGLSFHRLASSLRIRADWGGINKFREPLPGEAVLQVVRECRSLLENGFKFGGHRFLIGDYSMGR
jgi:hypothetical protein